MASTPTDRDPAEQTQLRISRRIERVFLGTIAALSVVAVAGVVGYYAGHGNNQTPYPGNMPMVSSYGAGAPQTVNVAMHDPGCHSFQVGSSFQKTLAVTGPVQLRNSDEAALEIAGSNGTVKDAVGQAVTLTPGSYRITMVDQAPDDNTLHLSVS
jgi:hypothetical protein